MNQVLNLKTRLVVRKSSVIQNCIQRNTDYSGSSLSQFMIDLVIEKANKVIDRTDTLNISHTTAKAMFDILDSPLKANEKLKKASNKNSCWSISK
jgi:uncharacterized protein (DUF1778 family)